jgi:hypothetical protein
MKAAVDLLWANRMKKSGFQTNLNAGFRYASIKLIIFIASRHFVYLDHTFVTDDGSIALAETGEFLRTKMIPIVAIPKNTSIFSCF